MARVKRGVEARRRHKKVLKQAKGYYGARSRVYRVAVQAVTKAGQYAYRDRRAKKAHIPQTVDCPNQCSISCRGLVIQQTD